MLAAEIAHAVEARVTSRGEGVEIISIAVVDVARELATLMSTGVYGDALRQSLDEVGRADALIMASPVFNASFSGLFKMFIDALDKDMLTGVPVVIAATAGTPRHALVLEHALRPLLSYLRAIVMPTAVFAATEDFAAREELRHRVQRAAQELAGYLVDVRQAVVGFIPEEEAGEGARSGAVQPGRAPRRTNRVTDVDAGGLDFRALLRGHDGNGPVGSCGNPAEGL